MAKINISFDTVTKLMSADMDGTAMTDIDEIQFYKDMCCEMDDDIEEADTEYRMRITQSITDEDNKLRTMHMTIAKDGSLENDILKSATEQLQSLFNKGK